MRPCSAAMLAGIILTGGVAMAQETTRPITGELTYRERIALPEGAVATVELRDETGRVVAEADFPTEGRQVPFPVEIAGPRGMPLTFRGAFQLGGSLLWITEPAEIAAGTEAVTLPPLQMQRFVPMGFASTYHCGGQMVEISFVNEGARLRIGSTYTDLTQVRTASGAKYAAEDDPDTYVWSKGTEVTVSLRGEVLPDCRIDVNTTAASADFLARGNEPGWTLALAGGQFTFTPQEGETVEGTLSGPEVMPQGRRYEAPEQNVILAIADAVCRDTMTGMPYPRQVTLMVGEEEYNGCGGAPQSLLIGPEWQVEDIAGGGLIDGSHVTMGFDATGRVAGSAGCNRFFAGYSLTGEGLAFDKAGATMMACPEALMNQERKFLTTLETVTGFDFSDDGALLLRAGGDTVIKARH